MPRHMGINRAYVAGETKKRPKKNKRNLIKKQKVLEKGGKVEKLVCSLTM